MFDKAIIKGALKMNDYHCEGLDMTLTREGAIS